jgi:hypothetical protein
MGDLNAYGDPGGRRRPGDHGCGDAQMGDATSAWRVTPTRAAPDSGKGKVPACRGQAGTIGGKRPYTGETQGTPRVLLMPSPRGLQGIPVLEAVAGTGYTCRGLWGGSEI